ncbi:SurA N-terminal domain-containing protein [Megalodesulfovibrio paquesii]
MMEFIRSYAHSWIIKILFGIIVIVFVFFGVNSFNAPRADVVATVNDTPILARDFMRTYERAVESLRRNNPNLDQAALAKMGVRKEVLMRMATDLLMQQEAKRQGLTVSDEELKQTIMTMSYFHNDRGQFDPAIYRALLARQNVSTREFEDETRSSILARKLEDAVSAAAAMTDAETKDFFLFTRMQAVMDYVAVRAADLLGEVNATDEEIAAWYAQRNETFRTAPRMELAALLFTPAALARNETITQEQAQAFYESNKGRMFTQEERVRARHILLRVEQNATPAEAGDVLLKMRDIKARLEKGEDFVALAQEFSDDTSKVVGGDLGWFGRGQMVPEFEAAAFSLQPGQVSEPVRTSFGYHLIKCEQREEAGAKSFDEVRDQVVAQLAQEQAAGRVADTLDLALEKILAGEQLDAISKDLDVPLETTPLLTREEALARFNMEPDATDSLFMMEDGEVSDAPLTLADGFMLVRVKQKTPASVKPLAEVREEIAARIKQEKALALAKTRAEALAKDLRAQPDSHADLVRSTAPFGRSEAIPELGASEALLKAAFDAETGVWLETPFALDDGYAAIRVARRIPPEDSQWDAEKELWKEHLTQIKQRELVEAYLTTLRENANFAITNPTVIE